VLLLTLVAMCLPSRAAVNPKEFRIGYQKAANTLVLLKAHGTLEQRLRPIGIEVTWSEFTAGPQLLEGLNVGSIDFGYVGEVPPIFALAAGANLVRHYQHLYRPIDDTVLTDQQKIADTFYELKLIPKKISVRDAVLSANR
jgi:sulfonate transport system substrate-binding protein